MKRIRIAASAFAVVGAMFLGTGVANAEPPAAGEAACKAAGGTYSKTSAGVESCCFQQPINSQGHHCYVYVGGVLSGTNFVNPGATGQGPHPVQPPPGTVAPVNPGKQQGPHPVQPPPAARGPVHPVMKA